MELNGFMVLVLIILVIWAIGLLCFFIITKTYCPNSVAIYNNLTPNWCY
jgi:hypothetical protein